MIDLSPRSPCAGLLPVTVGACTLAEDTPGPLTLLLPRPGRAQALSAALQAAHGLGFPAPGESVAAGPAACLWFGRDAALLTGVAPAPELAEHAGLSDQSDAWACVTLRGASGPDVLARLVPIDLRAGAFPVGRVARTLCGHMQAAVMRTGDDTLRLMVFRSMTGTLVDEVTHAMRLVDARRAGD